MRFFRLLDDVEFPGRWHLSTISDADNWRLARPPVLGMDDPLRDQVLKVGLRQSGTPLDYSLAGYAGVPVVGFKVLQAISRLDGLTTIPAKVEGFQQKTSYHILHFWDEADCVDEGASQFEKYQVNDPVRPDLAGNYSAFVRLVIDPSRTRGKHIFRLARSGVEVVISEEVKRRFEDAGVTGAVFQDVTGDHKPLPDHSAGSSGT
ncbi:MAG: hypothetical protein Q4G36_06980 [Paracoccus sp. (in: a-proteobacteria)]|nr:hypothetical protein [Paracoccus sp. (in: a-proteobacteria)]